MNKHNCIKVEGNTSLSRDTQTSAIINNDSSGYVSYMKRFEKQKNQNALLTNAIDDIDGLKTDMQEIKILLQKLMDRN